MGGHDLHAVPHEASTQRLLRFAHLDRALDTREGETLYQSARRQGVRIVGACGGRGTCGSCMVRVAEGSVARLDGAESRERQWVRSCQVQARSDCSVEVAPRSLAPVVRAEFDSDGTETLPLDPAVREVVLTLPEATLADPLGDAERLRRALIEAGHAPFSSVDLGCARTLPGRLRELDWQVRAVLRGDELIDMAPREGRLLGLAIDLGTTNAAGFLIDLRSGRRLASLGIENPQAAHGADLISRINHAVADARTAEELRRAAVTAINAITLDLARAVGADAGEIVDLTVCGNTAMHHLLLGLPVRQLGRAPFVAALSEGLDLKARELGLEACPGASVHVVPNVGGFVGGDHVTALLATEPQWRDAGTALVMDIGTNTEITLVHQGRFLSTSCPSGPALEGGHIGCGMRAAEGAIERVRLEHGRLAVQTIGGKEAVGLCGSGVLDAVAAMLRAGLVDARGRIAKDHPDVGESAGQRAVLLAPGVAFTQSDLRAVQLAKAAIRTAVLMLLREAGLQESDLQRFVIAGAFGAYIDVASGIECGLFPALPRERYLQVGNAAGLGVRQMLASRTARDRARELAESCRHVELSSRSDFQKTFMQTIGFAPLG